MGELYTTLSDRVHGWPFVARIAIAIHKNSFKSLLMWIV